MSEHDEFKKYATKHAGISGLNLYRYENSMTPYILEERQLRVTQMDIFSRLMMDRIIWIARPVDEIMASIIQAQLMFMDNQEKRDIRMHIDTPGGCVKSGLSIVDVMDIIECDIVTVNTGMCASMGSILLAKGTKGKRSSLRYSKVMLHQVSAGAVGNIQDMEITMSETKKYNDILFGILGDACCKTADEVKADATRDKWLTAVEAKDYGIIDEIVVSKKKI
jgi:ATP-dependent Clp protease protease subunit